MKHFQKVNLLAAAIGILAFSSAPAFAAPSQPIGTKQIDQYIEDYRRTNNVPGVAITITKHNETLYTKGYGHDANGSAITEESAMALASVSKSFTALAVMQLVDAGKVDLDKPVVTYLSSFAIADPEGKQITVRQVLNQTSGLGDLGFPEKSIRPQPTSLAAAVDSLKSARLTSKPGEQFTYHNPNYWIAGRIVEVVSGQSFAAYMEDNVFKPLGMNHTTTVDFLPQAGIPEGFRRIYGLPKAAAEPHWFINGGAGMVTTAGDMAMWLAMQNNAGKAVNGNQIISASSLQAMHTLSGSKEYGLGWHVDQDGDYTELLHGGWLFTYTAAEILLPHEGYGLAVMANTGISIGPSDAEVIADGLSAYLRGDHKLDAGWPAGILVDITLLLLSILAVALGIRNIRRSRKWAKKHKATSLVRLAAITAPRFVPLLLVVFLPQIMGFIGGGRDTSWAQLIYMATPLIIWLGVAAAANVTTVIIRARLLYKIRKS